MKITFIGDIACDRQLLKASQKKGGYDFSQVFSKVRIFLYNQILLWEILKRYVEVAIIIIKSSI